MNKFLGVFLLALSLSCIRTERPSISTSDFISVKGIISMETESFENQTGWKEKAYYTGLGIVPVTDEKKDTCYAEYPLNIDHDATYYIYILGNRMKTGSQADSCITVTLSGDHDTYHHSLTMVIPDMHVPVWSSVSYRDRDHAVLHVPHAGPCSLRLAFSGSTGCFLDKILLTTDPSFQPEGTGPLETRSGDPDSNRYDITLPPRWAFGVMYGAYTDQEESLLAVDSLISGDFPIDAYWIDSYFWDFNAGKGPGGFINFTGDTMAYPNIRMMWDGFRKRHVKAGIWIWNLINKRGNESVFNAFNDKGFFSGIYHNTNGWHNSVKDTKTGVVDFSNEEAVIFWKKKLNPFFEAGLDFLKLDNSSSIPFCKAAFTATQELGKETAGRGFILAHLHSTYDNRFKQYPTKWSGDAKICWSQPGYPNLGVYAMGGLKENIGMVADPKRSTYEIPFLTHDAGGYNYFGSREQSDELYMRWIQFASMNSLMTIFSTAGNPTRNHPYRYPQSVQENFRRYTHLRMRLFPYIYSYAIRTILSGKKIVQGDGIHEYQYLFGNELLVAPVYQQGVTEWNVYLPHGEWYDFDTDAPYQGGQDIQVAAPVEKLPMFVRKGAIIPMRHYTGAIETGNNDTLLILIYPSQRETAFTLYEDDGVSNDYRQGNIASTIMETHHSDNELHFVIHPVNGNYQGMHPDREYLLSFHDAPHPGKVLVNDRSVQQNGSGMHFEYDEQQRILNVFLHALLADETSILIKYREQ